jgi:hypothetical protein
MCVLQRLALDGVERPVELPLSGERSMSSTGCCWPSRLVAVRQHTVSGEDVA